MFFFFFQAEDGIRDGRVTGVQTCALPISFLQPIGAPPASGIGAVDLRVDRGAIYATFTLGGLDRKSTRLNSSHPSISYAVFCLKKKKDAEIDVLLRPLRENQNRYTGAIAT